MALSSSSFRFIQPAWDSLQYSRTDIIGRDMDRRGEYIASRARIQVGVDSGALRRTIRHATFSGGGGVGPKTVVAAGGPGVEYALMHHEGTRPHEIKPKSAKSVLKFNIGGKTVYASRVRHPGTRENKYLTDHLPMAVNI